MSSCLQGSRRIKSNFALLVFWVASTHTHRESNTHLHTPTPHRGTLSAICVHFNRCKSFKFIILCRLCKCRLCAASCCINQLYLPQLRAGGAGAQTMSSPRTEVRIECSLARSGGGHHPCICSIKYLLKLVLVRATSAGCILPACLSGFLSLSDALGVDKRTLSCATWGDTQWGNHKTKWE